MKYIIYSTPGCGYCIRAKNLLMNHKKDFEVVNLIKDDAARVWLIDTEGHKTVPQVYTVDALGVQAYVGGFEELHQYLEYD